MLCCGISAAGIAAGYLSGKAVFREKDSGEKSETIAGFRLIYDEFQTTLAKFGIKAFSPDGERFDPNKHEAMAQQKVEGAKSGTVVELFQQGYLIDGEVLRPARVVVAE